FVSVRHAAAMAVTACGILRPYPSHMSQMKNSASPDVGTITVSVTFFADLRRFLPRGADGPQPYRLTSNATLGDLLATIGIKPDADVTLALDGELAERDTPLHDGADIMLLSPMEGGSNDDKGHLRPWRPRPHAQRTESTPRVRPSGAAFH